MAVMDGMSAAVVLDRMDEMERKLDMITALLGAGGNSEHSKSTPARNEGHWSAGYDNGTSAVPKYSETDAENYILQTLALSGHSCMT